MVITKRDIQLFEIISELGFATSDTLRRIISMNTKQKTFNLRLAILKKAGFIREIRGDNRVMNQHSVYSLNFSKSSIEKIKTEIGLQFDPSVYNSSYQMYLHQIYLGILFASFLKKLTERVQNFNLAECKIFGSKKIQKELKYSQIHPHLGIEYSDVVMIPDISLIYGNSAFLFELENTNSYHQFEQKMKGYEEMLLKKDSSNFFKAFQGKNIQLIIATREAKKQRYEEILSTYSGKYSLVTIENLLKSK